MKINDTKLQSISVAPAKAAKETERSSIETAIAPSTANQPASALSASNKGTSALSFDVKKVDEIKLAISNGSFKVDSGKIADGIINSVRDILGNK